jgi:biopolymer transport protein ExbB
MNLSLIEIWHTMGIPAKVVGVFLFVMGMASLTVFVERLLALRRSRAASRKFATEAAEGMAGGLIEHTIEQAGEHQNGHLARLVRSALTVYVDARAGDDVTGLTPVERTRRHVMRRLEEIGADLRRGLSVLATVGSVAPFVGLLGTVLGIISAFQGIASTGSGGLSSVAAGISEALIETALGLAVAIPAVLAFNFLSTSIASDELALQTAAGELIDSLEGWGDPVIEGVRRERVA